MLHSMVHGSSEKKPAKREVTSQAEFVGDGEASAGAGAGTAAGAGAGASAGGVGEQEQARYAT